MFLSIGDWDLGLHSILNRGVRPHLEGNQRTPLSSRVATGISWSPECSEGSQASCGVWREDSGLLSSPCRERRPSPRDDRGVSWILSSCGACRKPARDIPLVKKVMRKEARHTQRRDRASGVPPDILEHLPPKPRVCLLYCFVLSPLTLLGAAPHQHLALSVKELTYSSN